ncbi:MAG: bifunctional metallophosphatase/5'-nucleotidase [Psychroflexus sp.]|uniref:bifunctional metallophosphatase/5'-nucleotidase n=1 Tax=Psychroflexus sp. S27 TaxID=1982757 RepID=UPI000C2AC2C2|nr:bifunctional metallophosphatase/5'-nucleotidase [Psychroflexus sp. S27]PJX25155.1 bifunctional metallophosphatase/5'-nucleotidase [Psychroflexus sp. S27]
MKRILFMGLIVGLTISCTTKANEVQEKESDKLENDTLTILQTADIHGQIFPHDELFWEDGKIKFKRLGGLAHMKTLFETERQKNPDGTLILDGGDLIQGSAVAALSKGSAFSPIIKNMNYDFLIPGNWEVVYGKKTMLDVLNAYETPVVAANMYDDKTEEHLFPPYFIKEMKGKKIGFISYNDPEIPVRQNPSFSKGIRFNKIHDNLQILIDKLKDEEGVDVLFVVSHIGISKQYNLANHPSFERVDYILGNDTHERIRQPLKGEYSKITEPGAFASFVGKLELIFDGNEIVKENYELMEVDPKKYPADKELAQIIDKAVEPYHKEINEVLGYTTTPLYRYFVVENPMDNFITDAMREKTGVDISFSNGFRFSPPLDPSQYKNGKAEITRAYLWNMLPVNEYVKTGKATGKQINDWLEQELHNVFAKNPEERFGGWLVRFSGMELKFNAQKQKGERIVSITVGGEPLRLDKEYSISACRREGEPDHMMCRMPNAIDPEIHDYTVHDVLAEYLKENENIAPEIDGRAKALDLGENVLSQLPGTNYQFH